MVVEDNIRVLAKIVDEDVEQRPKVVLLGRANPVWLAVVSVAPEASEVEVPEVNVIQMVANVSIRVPARTVAVEDAPRASVEMEETAKTVEIADVVASHARVVVNLLKISSTNPAKQIELLSTAITI